MPIYDFRCETCGPFVALRAIAERDAPCACPACGVQAARQLVAPALALMPGARRAAHATNERAAHAPR
ncbi:zinc ribbon domain-containing protein, partial [Burkholderia sp. Ac-20344]|uniref:FmdB family zinc ribbon protein n=1 Tax=Burkholderia sp. Ac-20344 TaxID=2703890 RepID=UPI00197B131A